MTTSSENTFKRAGRRFVSVALAAALASLTGACGDGTTGPSDVSLIEWSESFGFCPPSAYCATRVSVTGTQAVLRRESRQAPERRFTTQLTAAEADTLARLAVETRFDRLGPVVGCPDCADGGAETLSVVLEGQQRRVTFESGADIAELQPLLGHVRALAERLRLADPTP
jgi:hypothetical protein